MSKTKIAKEIDTLYQIMDNAHSVLPIDSYKVIESIVNNRLDKIRAVPMTDEEYSEHLCTTCPICRSEDIFHFAFSGTGGNYVTRNCKCETCGNEWQERYEFDTYIAIHK